MLSTVNMFFIFSLLNAQVLQALIDLEAVTPTGDMTSVSNLFEFVELFKIGNHYVFSLPFWERRMFSDAFSLCMQVRRSIQFFLNNLMNQRPDEATTFSAIGEVSSIRAEKISYIKLDGYHR